MHFEKKHFSPVKKITYIKKETSTLLSEYRQNRNQEKIATKVNVSQKLTPNKKKLAEISGAAKSFRKSPSYNRIRANIMKKSDNLKVISRNPRKIFKRAATVNIPGNADIDTIRK